MKMNTVAALATWAGLLLATAGCSTEAWYEGMKRRAQWECDQRPYGEREACRARVHGQSYDAYEKARAAEKP